MQTPLLVLLAFCGGALLAAQGPILSQLSAHVGGPLQGAAAAFCIGLIALVAVILLSGQALPRPAGLFRMPLWVWAGGFIGTDLLVLTLYAVPRIGVTVFVGAVVCGQLMAALAYDQIGAFGMTVRRIGWSEIGGMTLLLCGLVLIMSGDRS